MEQGGGRDRRQENYHTARKTERTRSVRKRGLLLFSEKQYKNNIFMQKLKAKEP